MTITSNHGDRLYALAGSSTPAMYLLRAADHDLTGLILDRTIKRYANLGCGASRGMLYVALRDAVEQRGEWLDDPQAYGEKYDRRGWRGDDVNAEVLAALFELVHGRHPCRACLNGSLLGGLDAIHPSGHQHRQEAA